MAGEHMQEPGAGRMAEGGAASSIPAGCDDALNRRILAVAEDQVEGFRPLPFDAIAGLCGLPAETVLERVRAMLAAGTIRRVRQTLLSTSLAEGALVAWKLPEAALGDAFEWLKRNDPFTGHIVIRRSENPAAPGADFRLWTTLKTPVGCGGVEAHCRRLAAHIGAERFAALPVVGMFALGVGHVRRAALEPCDKLPQPPRMQKPARPQLSPLEWKVLMALKESLEPEELVRDPWAARARAIGLQPVTFNALAAGLDAKHVIGRFAVFLDHTGKANRTGAAGAAAGVGASGLFHWAVPPGMEERAGAECGRHKCMTHCYWRSGGERFGGAQIMGVAHAATRQGVLAHKAAIDAHLADCGIPIRHTAVFWSERAEIRPSEIDPYAYRAWLVRMQGRQG